MASENKFDVFVSYSRSDGEFVASLLSRLEDENIRTFADRSIEAGEQWLPRLEYALRNSEVILFLLTPASLRSSWVNAEAGAAWILKKTLLPVLLDANTDHAIELLRSYQAHDLAGKEDVDDLIARLIEVVRPSPPPSTDPNPTEFFNAKHHWDRLLLIGDWSRIEETEEIIGAGMHTYLLSHFQHGPEFSLTARITIMDAHPVNSLDAVNAGIVLGWTTPKNVRRYYNLLFTRDRLLLELVGGRGGGAYEDFEHVDEGVEFAFREGIEYTVSIDATRTKLAARIRGDGVDLAYTTDLIEPLSGRVGLRPWRSTIRCTQFNVVTG